MAGRQIPSDQIGEVVKNVIPEDDVVGCRAQRDRNDEPGYNRTSPLITVTASPPTRTSLISPPFPTTTST